MVVMPWIYLILPFVTFWATVYYFRREERTFLAGLKVSFFWFAIISLLSVFEIAGPYYLNFAFYFSSLRNWFLLAFILLIPPVYSLFLEGRKAPKSSKLLHGKPAHI